MSVSSLSTYQFGEGRGKVTKDPTSDTRKPVFSGAKGAKTMKVSRGKGLPTAQKVHHHREHAGARSHRAR